MARFLLSIEIFSTIESNIIACFRGLSINSFSFSNLDILVRVIFGDLLAEVNPDFSYL